MQGFVAVAAAAAGAKERVGFYFFYRFRRDVRHFCCAFLMPFRHEIRWCFGVARGFVFCMVSCQWQQLEQRSVCVSTFSRDSEGTLGTFAVRF